MAQDEFYMDEESEISGDLDSDGYGSELGEDELSELEREFEQDKAEMEESAFADGNDVKAMAGKKRSKSDAKNRKGAKIKYDDKDSDSEEQE